MVVRYSCVAGCESGVKAGRPGLSSPTIPYIGDDQKGWQHDRAARSVVEHFVGVPPDRPAKRNRGPYHGSEDEQASQAELEVGHHGGIGRVNMKKNSAPNAVTVAIESPASDAPSVVAISVRRLN